MNLRIKLWVIGTGTLIHSIGSMNLSVCHEAHGQVPMTHYGGLVNRRMLFHRYLHALLPYLRHNH